MVCVKILCAPYDLVSLEECLRNNQYLRLKGISSFEEEGENILNRLVSIEERTLLKGIDSRTCLNYKTRQNLYERRLKLTKALPIMLRELSHLEDENPDQVELYIKQKSEFTVGTCMLIDQIDNILRRDDQLRQTMGFQAVKSPKFYQSSEQLWAEMLVDIIKTAAAEHEECMKSLDDMKAQRQTKHIGVGKTSKPKSQNVIPSTVSAFQRVVPNISKGWEALPVFKEMGCQEAIEVAAKF